MLDFVKQHFLVAIVSMLALVMILTLAIPLILQSSQLLDSSTLSNALNTVQQAGYRVLGAGVNLDGDLLPSANNTWKLGNTSFQWSQGWFNQLNAVTTNSTFVNTAQVTDSSLTNGQVVYAGAGGILQSNSGMTYNPSLNTLISTTANVTTLNAPTGRGATYVIAASDATATEKAQADVVCDGTNDEVEIQAGITAGAGGTVILTSGTFHKDNATGLTIPSNTTVENHGTILLKANAGNTPYIFNINGVTNIHIIGGVLDGNMPNHTTITGDAFNISFTNVTNSSIEGVRTINTGTTQVGAGGYNIYLNGSSNNRIINNDMYNSRRSNIAIYNNSNSNTVTGNVASTTNSVSGGDNYNIHTVTDCVLSGNVGLSSGSFGIFVLDSSRVTVSNNVVESSRLSGIEVDTNSIAINIQGNSVYNANTDANNAYGGITTESTTVDSVVSNNNVANSNYYGIYILGNRMTANANNVYYAANIGMYLKASNSVYSNNNIYHSGNYGFFVSGQSNSVFSGNIFNSCNTFGIYSTGSVVDSLYIGNKFIGGGITNVAFEQLVSGTNNIVENNDFRNGWGSSAVVNNEPSTIFRNNDGYIAHGEVRTYTFTVAGAADAGAINKSVDNPFGQAVRITNVDVEITTQAGAAATLDLGIGSSATADYTTAFAALPANPGTSYPYFYSAARTATYGQMAAVAGTNWASGSGNRYFNVFNPSVSNTTSLAATVTVTVMGN